MRRSASSSRHHGRRGASETSLFFEFLSRATDTSVVAKAIGITEAELNTALASGQTVAAVAKAHNVPLQTVIDALVADGTSELAAEVAKGTKDGLPRHLSLPSMTRSLALLSPRMLAHQQTFRLATSSAPRKASTQPPAS